MVLSLPADAPLLSFQGGRQKCQALDFFQSKHPLLVSLWASWAGSMGELHSPLPWSQHFWLPQARQELCLDRSCCAQHNDGTGNTLPTHGPRELMHWLRAHPVSRMDAKDPQTKRSWGRGFQSDVSLVQLLGSSCSYSQPLFLQLL